MSSIFNIGALGSNPFSTAVGHRIEQATDASLVSEDWALNIEICDLINESSDAARDAMKAIRKRFTQNAGKNYTVIMYTLTVLETCVKNCGKPFHVLVANKEFIQELVKLIGPKNDPPPIVQETVLNLIQVWSDAFRSQPELNGVVQVYQELKNKGIEFPATNLDSIAPIFTPQRSVPDGSADQPTTQQVNNINIPPSPIQAPVSPAVMIPQERAYLASEDQVAKLQSELDIVQMNMSILGEMLTELKPGQEDPDDYNMLTILAATCKEMQGRIVELIGKVQHDELTADLLRLNDELNNLFLRHTRYEKNRDPNTATSATPSAILGAALGVPTEEKDKAKDSLIDLSDEAAGGRSGLSTQLAGMSIGGTAASQLSQINSVNAQSGASTKTLPPDVVGDEFDMFAQSRNNTYETSKTSGSTYTDNTNIETHPGSLGAAVQNKSQLPAKETEFDEMEKWLGNEESGEAGGVEESLTSKEFEKFLAERAAVAENLPTISSQIGDSSRDGSNRHKKKDKDEGAHLAL